MRVFRRSKFQRHIVIPLMLVCFMAACHKWVPVEPPVEQMLAEHDGEVRLTLEDGRRVEVNSGRVALAFLHAQRDTALSDVAKAEVRKSDVVGTLGLVVGISAALFLSSLF
jgi:ferric-dicitrate binding protein FerR (iron transport regulator)